MNLDWIGKHPNAYFRASKRYQENKTSGNNKTGSKTGGAQLNKSNLKGKSSGVMEIEDDKENSKKRSKINLNNL